MFRVGNRAQLAKTLDFWYSGPMRITWPSVSTVAKSLSARLLILTLFFVMVSEVLIYVPSIAQFRRGYLEQRIASAELASLALEATPDQIVDRDFEQALLDRAEAKAVVVKRQETRTLILGNGTPPSVDASFDLRGASLPTLVRDAFGVMLNPDRTVRVVAEAEDMSGVVIELVLDEAPLRSEMFRFSGRILSLSLIISFVTAGLVFLSLNMLMVRPMRRITASMVGFRQAPEDESSTIVPTSRRDEIGTAQRELADMQSELRAALKQKERLAELGTAVSKINHDLRNILATAQLVSDRIAGSGDPEVRRLTPTLMSAIDRAVELCSQTLQFGRAREAPPQRSNFAVRDLVDDIRTSLGISGEEQPIWENEISANLQFSADREQIFRALMNLCRNALEAIAGQSDGRISLTAGLKSNCATIYIADNGPGLPDVARENLFEPFKGSARAGGTGLGLTISRDLVRAHGGDLTLYKSDEYGTTFRIEFPSNLHEIGQARSRKASM